MSINISLNSLMNGGNTRIEIVNMKNDINRRTISNEKSLGNFNPVCIWLHKLQITFEITSEHIIKRIKSLNVHIINKVIIIKAKLK